MKTAKQRSSFSLGFTLIELLIVIAVLGVLAAVVLVAINPLEQLARGRDAGRKSTSGQLAKAVLAYYTSQNTNWPLPDNQWISSLVSAGEVKTVPAQLPAPVRCDTNAGVESGFCYQLFGTAPTQEAIVYVLLESTSEDNKCAPNGATNEPYFLWSSTMSRSGTVCMPNGTSPTGAAGYTFF